MTDLLARPLSRRDETAGEPPAYFSPFRASWSATVGLLDHEMRQLGVGQLILEMDIEERDLRHDGWIRADTRPGSAAVVVTFEHPVHGWLRYPCAQYRDWEGNVRAIALALQALRAVDRYGVTRKGEQYTGWKALPATTGATMTTEAAATLVATGANPGVAILAHPKVARAAVLAALKRSHPDVAGGSRDAFEAIQTARRVLTAHHGVAV